jgi:hypothetical protein
MNYEEFEQTIRPRFSQTFDIVIKQSSRKLWQRFIEFLKSRHYLISFSSSQTEKSNEVNYEDINRYFDGKDPCWPSLEVNYKQLRLECFIEKETEIVLWFNDRLEELNKEKFSDLKQLMQELAKEFSTEVYFMNEDAISRYKLFTIKPDGSGNNFNLSDYSLIIDEEY